MLNWISVQKQEGEHCGPREDCAKFKNIKIKYLDMELHMEDFFYKSWNTIIFSPLMQIHIQWLLLNYGNRGGFIFMFWKFLLFPQNTIFFQFMCRSCPFLTTYKLEGHANLDHHKSKLPYQPGLACQSWLPSR